MRIAISGGTGFIGRGLLRSLPPETRALVLGRWPEPPEFIAGYANAQYVHTDYRTDNLLNQIDGCDALVHLAARRPGAEPESVEHYLGNIAIAEHLLDVCHQKGIRNIVNVSCAAVYGSENTLPWREDQYPRPMTAFGLSKVAIEQLGQFFNRCHGLGVKTLRLAPLIGAGIPEATQATEFIQRALTKETLFVAGNGRGRREYLYIKDAVGAILTAIKRPELGGIYNIGSGRAVTHRDLAENINEVFSNQGNMRMEATADEDISTRLMDSRKAALELGFSPRWNLRAALEDMRNKPGDKNG